jgi:hypothetical protein
VEGKCRANRLRVLQVGLDSLVEGFSEVETLPNPRLTCGKVSYARRPGECLMMSYVRLSYMVSLPVRNGAGSPTVKSLHHN